MPIVSFAVWTHAASEKPSTEGLQRNQELCWKSQRSGFLVSGPRLGTHYGVAF